MIDIESLCNRFKFGDLEDIFVMIYSYFIIGYLILFTTYEQNFINLQLFTQIILSVAISLPIMSITSVLGMNLLPKKEIEKLEKRKTGFFYDNTIFSFYASIYYTSIFSLIYIFKHSKIVDYTFGPSTTVWVIFFSIFALFIEIMLKRKS